MGSQPSDQTEHLLQAMESQKGSSQEDKKECAANNPLWQSCEKQGLDAAYWFPILLDILGVKSKEALQHLQYEDYLKLECKVRHPWEKKALLKLMDIEDKKKTAEDLQKKRLEVSEERHKSALKDLKEMQKEIHHTKELKKEEELQKVLDIPQDFLDPPENRMVQVVEKMQKQLEQQEKSACSSATISDEDVLRRASGGLALQGIYRTSCLEDMLAKREQLIKIPEGFQLAGAEQGSVLEKKEFSSAAAEATFTKSMEQLGFSMSMAAKASFLQFNVEAALDYSNSSHSVESHQSRSEQAYFCSTKYCYVPVASCYFQRHQLCLSDAALQELRGIEQLLSITPEANQLDMLKSKCGSFFHRFGSHVNQGPLHFGGIFWWKASVEGFRVEEREDMKRQASQALNSRVAASYENFVFSAAGDVRASQSSSKASFKGRDRKEENENVLLFVTKTGGPLEVDSFDEWKSRLVNSNTTWCVIDRGFQLIPVWDIILSHHGQDFRNVHQLSSSVQTAYERLTNLPVNKLCEEGTVSALGQTQPFLDEIKSWEVSEAEQHLVKLMIFKQELIEKTKSNMIWVGTCLTNKVLQDFLVNTVSLYKYSSLPNTSSIKFILRCLLDPHIFSVDNFPKSSFIMQWIFHEEEEEPPRTSCISEFSDLLHNLREMKNLMEEAAFGHPPEIETEGKIKVTLNLSLALCSFLKALRERGEADVESLLLCIAESAGYQEENSTFRYLLALPEVGFMLSEMKKAYERYVCLKNQAIPRAQAFLILTGLRMAAKRKDTSPEQKFKCLTRMKHRFGTSLSEEVSDILRKHGGCDPEGALARDLAALVNGEYAASNSDLQKEIIKQELINICSAAKQKDASKPSAQQSDDPEMNEGSRGQEFRNLIKYLGLENYYPRKMRMADFHIIDKTSLRNSKPRTGSEYPVYFLQKLLMLDYRVRYLVCQDDSRAKEGILSSLNAPSLGIQCSDDSSDIYSDFLNANDEEMNVSATAGLTHIHPMDLQMAIFHCADDFMRQYISTKLAFCQLALPLLVPNPCTSQIEFPLWALSQIKKSWKGTEKLGRQTTIKSHKNKLIYQAETPIVSFIRIGSSPSSSKSQILNALLSEHKHDTFFHRHCKGSTKECLLMKGVVEISWYCPSGSADDRFENCIAFTNLHGDAREYKQQVKFIQEIASVNVVLLTTSDENEVGRQLVRDLLKSPKPFVCLLTEKEGSAVSITKQNLVVADKRNLNVKIPIKNRNEADLVDNLANTIRVALEDAVSSCSLDTCAGIARKYGFLLDIDKEDCKEAKAMAQALVAFCKENNVASVKEKFLPLQGKLWHEWCSKDKELTHLQERNVSIEQHRSEIESQKRAIRQKQLEKGCPPNELMKPVLKIILSESESTKKYFLEWMKMFMDALSADHLDALQQKYHSCWTQMKENVHSEGNVSAGDNLRRRLEALSAEISASTIGLEHILREIGQIYEALDVNTQKDEHFLQLPRIAAKLMISGYPVELMDGDASYVPLEWVGAIFDRLAEMLGDKRVYVLSVLGIQSTGKSTLLNAMFGLQFNVSAGRCTRGAFMRLLKVDKDLQEDVNFDYMLIVDTEGLRAIELANKQSLNHDNELATFVIGIGNMTLINIFGENPSEMQDVLQIAVQAFLRMKQVNLSPSCLFVHQNVGEITAKEQNMEGQRRLQQKLDEMTVAAAQQEFCDATCFSDVIRFDVNTHVHYFAHLWEGNPPMAPPNPAYSQNVQELKSKILQAAKKESQGRILRFSSLKVRIRDLWKALLNEKFVFSFKNTLEIAAYNKLETVYSQWTWQLRSHVLDLQRKLNNRIKKGEIQHITRRTVTEEVQEKYKTILNDLECYFREDEDSGILKQWKGSIERKLNNLKEVLIDDTLRKSADFIELKKNHNKLDQKKSEYEQELLKRSQKLALTLKNEELSEEKLRQHFDGLWKKWVYEVSSTAPPPAEPNINLDIENILLEHFKQEPNIGEKVKCFLQKDVFTIDISEHVMKRSLRIFKKPLDSCEIAKIEQLEMHITQLVSTTIDTKEQEAMDYNQSYIHEILNKIREELDSAASESKYIFSNEYRIHLSLYLCKMAAERFENMHKDFKTANDPTFYLESKRKDFFKIFHISCQGATSITAFADFLCERLSAALRQAVYAKTAIDIACEMRSNYPAFNGNRSKLETAILISLAEEEDFEKFRQYIHFPKVFLESFIENCVNNYCLDKKNPRLKNFLSISLNSFQTLIVSAIVASTQVVKDKCGNVSLWLDEFCSRLGDNFELPRSDLKNIEHQEIKDIEFLKEAMNKALDSVLEQLKREFSVADMKPFNLKPHKILFDQLHGCWEQCPFCNALCTSTIPDHDGDHSVHFHRPQVLNGTQWTGTNHFVIEICSTLVASNSFLVLGENNEIPYKYYRRAGPAYANWSITPDSSMQAYWKWFVCHFRSQLEEDYCAKFAGKGSIPPEWMKFTKKDVISELEELLPQHSVPQHQNPLLMD